MNPDRLDALMVLAAASWENGRYLAYSPHELRVLDEDLAAGLALGLQLRRALGCRLRGDLEWTVLLVPGLAHLLDESTGGFGGTWPVRSATAAVASRVLRWEDRADDWAAGSTVGGPTLLEILMSACPAGDPA